jgi:hypothetical protein
MGQLVPLHPGVACTTLNSVQIASQQSASAADFTCGACPAGYRGNGVSCTDVDECGDGTNGGCDVLATCNNTVGGRTCGACPTSHRGDGVHGCRLIHASCDVSRGGCDPRAACIPNTGGGGGNTCGPCPGGTVGTGDTACVDADGGAVQVEST